MRGDDQGRAGGLAKVDWLFVFSLRGLPPDPHPETAGAEGMKQPTKFSAARWPSGGRSEAQTTKTLPERAVHRMLHTLREAYFQQAPK